MGNTEYVFTHRHVFDHGLFRDGVVAALVDQPKTISVDSITHRRKCATMYACTAWQNGALFCASMSVYVHMYMCAPCMREGKIYDVGDEEPVVMCKEGDHYVVTTGTCQFNPSSHVRHASFNIFCPLYVS